MREITKEEAIAYAEINNILENIGKEYCQKIPKSIVDFIKNNALKSNAIDMTKEDINISILSKQILCYLNLEYWSTETEKQELIKQYTKNQEKINEQYDITKIFETKKPKKYQQNAEETHLAVKQTWLQKILSKIKRIR